MADYDDRLVGNRIMKRRWFIGMVQEDLAERIGVSCEQMQKYENGANRVSASRLRDIAEVLNVPVNFFFDGTETSSTKAHTERNDDAITD